MRAEVVADDEVARGTTKIEGATINYNGELALGWQALFTGPFMTDQILTGDNTPVSKHLCELLENNAALWRDAPAYFYADSGSSEGKHLDAISRHFTRHSVSYNKWTGPLERIAHEQPASAWQEHEGVRDTSATNPKATRKRTSSR